MGADRAATDTGIGDDAPITDTRPHTRSVSDEGQNLAGLDGQQSQVKLYQPAVSALAGVKFLPLREIHDARGTLTVCQWDQQLPFSPRRVFLLHDVPSEEFRGEHAHKECIQVLVCINGSVNVLLDDGQTHEEHILNASHTALLIPPGIWATLHRYSANATLIVFASHNYDADDYIRDYEQFLSYRSRVLDSAA